jgi:hypothetical protein
MTDTPAVAAIWSGRRKPDTARHRQMTADTIQPPSVLLVADTSPPGPGDHSLSIFIRYQRTAAAMPQTSHHKDGVGITSFAPDPPGLSQSPF